MIGKHIKAKNSENALDRQRAGADVRAREAVAADRFGITKTAIVPATSDSKLPLPKEDGRKTTEEAETCSYTQTAIGGGDVVSWDHDNARYHEVYRHQRKIR